MDFEYVYSAEQESFSRKVREFSGDCVPTDRRALVVVPDIYQGIRRRGDDSRSRVGAGRGDALNHMKRPKFYARYLGDATYHKLRMARLPGLEVTS